MHESSRLLRVANLEYALIQGLYWGSFCGSSRRSVCSPTMFFNAGLSQV